jgi:hypothetical protein
MPPKLGTAATMPHLLSKAEAGPPNQQKMEKEFRKAFLLGERTKKGIMF